MSCKDWSYSYYRSEGKKATQKFEKTSPECQSILAGCHTLIKQGNELVGDQAELKFFEMTKWKYTDFEKKATSPNKQMTVRILKVN